MDEELIETAVDALEGLIGQLIEDAHDPELGSRRVVPLLGSPVFVCSGRSDSMCPR